MDIKEKLEALKLKEMDRKEFLKYGLTITLALVGVTGLVRTLVGSHNGAGLVGSAAKVPENSNAYGASAYGR